MRLKARLYLTVAAIGIASLLAAAPAQLRAQTAVAIDNDDIGGVVTGARNSQLSMRLRNLERMQAGGRM